MADATIDNLVINLKVNSSAAATSLNKLTASLNALKTSVGGSAQAVNQISRAIGSLKSSLDGLNLAPLQGLKGIKISSTIATQLQDIGAALELMPSGAGSKINDLTALSRLNSIKLSASASKNLSKLASAVRELPLENSSKIYSLAKSLEGFKNLQGLKLTTTMNGLQRLPQILQEFTKLNMDAVTKQFEKMSAALPKLTDNVVKLAAAFNSLPKSMQDVYKATNSVSKANSILAKSTANGNLEKGGFLSTLGGWRNKLIGVAGAYQVVKRVIKPSVEAQSAYYESMNRFAVAMGEYESEAESFGRTVADALGIDFAEWESNQSLFMSLATGMGVASDKAAFMSKNLTQLGYDLSSYMDIPVENAMLKLQSGLAGELEPLRRIGFDLSNARLQQDAFTLGIHKNIQEMTQSEKIALRYHAIMTQLPQAHTDLARTVNSPANMMRRLQAALAITARTIGGLVIPAITAVIPYFLALLKVIQHVATAIAKFFGFELEPDVSGLTQVGVGFQNMGDSAGQALDDTGKKTDKARKKLEKYKNTILGFDQLNVLNPMPEDTDTSSGGSGSDNGGVMGGAGFDIPLEGYNMLDGYTDEINKQVDEITKHIEDMLPIIGLAAAGFAAWKIFEFLGDLGKTVEGVSTLAELVPTVKIGNMFDKVIKIAGFAGAIWGVITAFQAFKDMVEKGINTENLDSAITGISAAVIGIFVALGKTQAGVAAIIGGLSLFVISIQDILNNGLNPANFDAALTGLALVMAGLWAVTGGNPIVVAIAGVIGGIILVFTGFKDALANGWNTENIKMVAIGIGLLTAALGVLFGIPGIIAGVIAGIIALIVANWDTIVAFFGQAIEFIGGVFATIWETISGFFGWLGQGVIDVWNGIVETVSGVAAWIDENIIQPVLGFFGGLFGGIGQGAIDAWNGIVGVWNSVTGWFNNNIIQPVSNFFKGLWEGNPRWALDAWNGIKNTFGGVASWFNSTVIQPVKNFFGNMWNGITSLGRNAVGGIKGIFSGIGNIASGLGQGVAGAAKGTINTVLGGVDGLMQGVSGGLNGALGLLKGVDILGLKPFSWIPKFSLPRLPRLATGGIVSTGQLFIANEAGPEMVGRYGNKTGVVNNDQIVSAIEHAVTNAMVQAFTYTSGSEREQNIEIPLIIGGEEIARAVHKGNQSLIRRGEIKADFGAF